MNCDGKMVAIECGMCVPLCGEGNVRRDQGDVRRRWVLIVRKTGGGVRVNDTEIGVIDQCGDLRTSGIRNLGEPELIVGVKVACDECGVRGVL